MTCPKLGLRDPETQVLQSVCSEGRFHHRHTRTPVPSMPARRQNRRCVQQPRTSEDSVNCTEPQPTNAALTTSMLDEDCTVRMPWRAAERAATISADELTCTGVAVRRTG